MFCEDANGCGKAPGSEDMPSLECRAPINTHTTYNAKTNNVETEKSTPRKFCVGYKQEGEDCNQYLCDFGMTCSEAKGGKCVKDTYKYHDWWTYDDSLTTHAST